MANERYDVIIIGSGAGGGTLAYKLAPSGKRILLLERGGYLPREIENWSPRAVHVEERYHTREQWYDKDGAGFHPGTGYWVGGNTKVYGAALVRLRERDFDEVHHHGGVSPAWPLRYSDFEPYYTQAEHLYQVHGARGEDPTEPPSSAPYSHPAVTHEPRIQQLHDDLEKRGLKPFHVPLGVLLDEANPHKSACIRCETCDGSGAAPGTESATCPQCQGRGEVRQVRQTMLGQMVNVTVCTRCQGEGRVVDKPCHSCRGEGRIPGRTGSHASA